jgi:phosphoglucosamine mutase
MKLFGTSGVRGVVGKEITPDFLERIGKAIATYLGESSVGLAYDTRPSKDHIRGILIDSLTENGCNAVDLGILTTPGLAYLTRDLGLDTGIMITASHNPPEYNGIKLFDKTGMGYSPEAGKSIEKLFENPSTENKRKGKVEEVNGIPIYVEGLLQCMKATQKYKIVTDCSCGSASIIAPSALRQLGHEVFEVNCSPDITKCNRDLETKPDSLGEAIQKLKDKKADIVACFDGDADRIIFADEQGFIGYDEAIAFISKLKLTESSNKEVVTTVETGNMLDEVVRGFNGKVIRTRVGDTPVAYETKRRNACLGVEQVGVYIHPEFGFFPSAIYTLAYLVSRVSHVSQIREEIAKLPKYYSGKIRIDCPNSKKANTMKKIKMCLGELNCDCMNDLDGFRLEYPDSWVLVRPSGTEPIIRVSGESKDHKKLQLLLEKTRKLVEECLCKR